MQGCATREDDSARRWRCLPALSCACAAVLFSAALGAAFRVEQAATRLHDGVYRLNARFDLGLPPAPRAALDSGVPLYLTIDMRVSRERNWWWDETVAALAQRYRVEYHALSGRYLAVNLNTGVRRSFHTVDQALAHVGLLQDFPLLDRVLVSEAWRYMGEVSVSLDLGKLPLPLVPGAFFSGEWRLHSGDYQWLLK